MKYNWQLNEFVIIQSRHASHHTSFKTAGVSAFNGNIAPVNTPNSFSYDHANASANSV